MHLFYLLLSCQSDPTPPKEKIWIPGWEFTPQSYREAELNIEGERWSISTSEGAFSFRLMTESKYKGQKKVEKAIDSWVWNETKQELSSAHRIAEMNWRFHVDIQDTHLQLRIEVDGNEKKEIQRERLWLEVEAIDIEHLGRDYRWRSLEKRYALDRWTPQYLRLYTPDGMVRMRGEAESVWLEEKKGRYRIALELSHQANHPLKIFRKCYAQYEEAQEEERVNRYAQPSRFVRKANLFLSLNEGPLLEPLRYPHRYKAAISFNDHADQSNLLKLKALMLGTSTERSENKKGFAGHGLSMSKSVFVREAKGYDRQGSSEPYVDLLEEIQNTSTQEIGLHSVSGEVDNRTQTEAGLAFAERLQSMGGGRFWIDHQPSTNCEAISNEGGGYRRGARAQYQIVDLLKEYGYHYVWAGFDLPPPADGINLFDPERPENRSPVLYTHSGIDSAGSIFLFS
ncbi:MAG: hypothetical protein VX278_12310, partial [Myxococcota bacterium]|nr:hypothetical protein [Myxococcota bacterium]